MSASLSHDRASINQSNHKEIWVKLYGKSHWDRKSTASKCPRPHTILIAPLLSCYLNAVSSLVLFLLLISSVCVSRSRSPSLTSCLSHFNPFLSFFFFSLRDILSFFLVFSHHVFVLCLFLPSPIVHPQIVCESLIVVINTNGAHHLLIQMWNSHLIYQLVPLCLDGNTIPVLAQSVYQQHKQCPHSFGVQYDLRPLPAYFGPIRVCLLSWVWARDAPRTNQSGLSITGARNPTPFNGWET